MATKYEYYIINEDHARAIHYWKAQTFTPSVGHIITSVKLKLYRINTPGTITARIRATDANGAPTGSNLCSGTTDGDTLTTDTAGEWREITFSPGALLLAGTKYAIVYNGGGTDTNRVYAREDESTLAYLDGNEFFSDSMSDGGNWTSQTIDIMFEEWGDPQGSGEGGSIFPTDAITRVTNIIHRYNRKEGVYTMEVSLGEVTTDFGLPEWLSKPTTAISDVPDIEEMYKALPGAKEAIEAALARGSEVALQAIKDREDREKGELARQGIRDTTEVFRRLNELELSPRTAEQMKRSLKEIGKEVPPAPPKVPWWKKFVGGKERIGE